MKKRISLAFFALVLTLASLFCVVFAVTASADESQMETVAAFDFGANGSATHVDGNAYSGTKTYTNGAYTLTLLSLNKVYGPAYDAKGNSCIKLGSSSAVGGFSFTVPDDITSVVIHVAKYKSNTTKINVNETAYTLTKNSNDGAYDAITVDTSSNKTVSFTTVSGGVRCMINGIDFLKEKAPVDTSCEHLETTTKTVPSTCTSAGYTVEVCANEACNEFEVGERTPLELEPHNYVDNLCSVCRAVDASALTTDEAILKALYALASGESLPGTYTLKGVIISVNTPYDSEYGSVTVTIEIEGLEDYPVTCFRLKGEGADQINVGDTITVSGTLTNYSGTREFSANCTLDAVDKPLCQHDNTSTVTVEATCTEAGSITETCDDCGTVLGTEEIAKIAHNYVDGFCDDCGAKEAAILGRFYIATIRSSGNYWYMKADLGTAGTKRYQIIDSGLTALPEYILESEANVLCIFAIVGNEDGTYSIFAEGVPGDNYLGWTSGNSGTFVSAENALKLTMDEHEDGTVSFHFTGDVERYLALNQNSGSNYFAWYKSGQKQNLTLIPVTEPPHEHVFVEGKCECGEVDPDYVAPTPSVTEIADASLNIGADLSLLYYITLANGENIADYKMAFTFNGVTYIVTDYVVSGDGYVFAFKGIAPQCMGDAVDAVLLKGDAEVARYDGLSIVKFAELFIAQYGENEAFAPFITLLGDILAYGRAAQKYQDYNTDNLVAVEGANASASLPTDADNKLVVGEAASDDVYFTAAGVKFDYLNQIYVKFAASSLDGVEVKFNGVAAEIAKSGDKFIAYSAGIAATALGDAITVELIVDGVAVQTFTYSVNTYIFRMYEDADMAELVLALYNYGKSAAAIK